MSDYRGPLSDAQGRVCANVPAIARQGQSCKGEFNRLDSHHDMDGWGMLACTKSSCFEWLLVRPLPGRRTRSLYVHAESRASRRNVRAFFGPWPL